jgi:hypothetical protein
MPAAVVHALRKSGRYQQAQNNKGGGLAQCHDGWQVGIAKKVRWPIG